MSDIKFPPDLMQLPQFRQMATALGGGPRALMAWWLLFSQLKYLSQEGHPVGRVPESEVATFKISLDELARENGAGPHAAGSGDLSSVSAYSTFELMTSSAVKLLKADGPDWVCPRYQVLNAEPVKSLSSLGGNMKAFKQRQGNLGKDSMQLALNIHESKFVDEEGVALPPEIINRVTRLIISCDNALYKPPRPPAGFGEGLIQTALQVSRNNTDEDIAYVCEQVALHRDHPRLIGYTTERLLPVFRDLLKDIANG